LNVRLQDPGVNLVEHGQPDSVAQAPGAAPLTRMAKAAIQARGRQQDAADDVQGYNDYRGVRVIGAWRWLDEYDFGITTEIDASEAFVSLHFLRTVMWSGLGLAGLLATLVTLLALHASRAYARALALQGSLRKMGQYELFEMIGRGGMGTVYRGSHQLLRRDVAVKVLEKVENDGTAVPLSDELAIERFEREVRMTSMMKHPNTIDVYDFGRTEDGTFFYVMEHVDGMNLRRLVRFDGAQCAGRVIHVLLQICGSIQEAHDGGLIHRDIKPGNVVLTNFSGMYDMAKVLDFGLVRSNDPEQHTVVSSAKTTSASLTGTPMYLAPEVIRDSNRASISSDVYAIGAVGYELLTGLPPYEADHVTDVCMKRLDGDPERPGDRIRRELPVDLQNVLMSCLRADPLERPASAAELAESLRLCQDADCWTELQARVWWQTHVPSSCAPHRPLARFANVGKDPGKRSGERTDEPSEKSGDLTATIGAYPTDEVFLNQSTIARTIQLPPETLPGDASLHNDPSQGEGEPDVRN
ncbi:MAG: serine/threonine-protein kinase, partial [Planctomycetota bacterium]